MSQPQSHSHNVITTMSQPQCHSHNVAIIGRHNHNVSTTMSQSQCHPHTVDHKFTTMMSQPRANITVTQPERSNHENDITITSSRTSQCSWIPLCEDLPPLHLLFVERQVDCRDRRV